MANDVKIQDVKTISKVLNRNCFMIIFLQRHVQIQSFILSDKKSQYPKKAV